MDPLAQAYLNRQKSHWTELAGKVGLTMPLESELPRAEAANATLAEYICTTFGDDIREEVAAHQWDLDYWLTQLEQRLYDDLQDYCTQEEQAILREAAVAYLPLTNANAYAEHVPHEPKKHVVVVHLHLIWVAFYLTQALLLAAKQDEIQAREAYYIGLRGYLQNNFLDAFRIWLETSANADDWLMADAGAVSTVILRFVGLHELGHLVLGHVDKAGMCYAHENKSVKYSQAERLGQAEIWALEYAADRFAIDHMLTHTGSAEQMWNNLLFIGAFFRFIAHVDILRNAPLSVTHPTPEARLNALVIRVTEVVGEPPNDAQYWAESLLLEWRDD